METLVVLIIILTTLFPRGGRRVLLNCSGDWDLLNRQRQAWALVLHRRAVVSRRKQNVIDRGRKAVRFLQANDAAALLSLFNFFRLCVQLQIFLKIINNKNKNKNERIQDQEQRHEIMLWNGAAPAFPEAMRQSVEANSLSVLEGRLFMIMHHVFKGVFPLPRLCLSHPDNRMTGCCFTNPLKPPVDYKHLFGAPVPQLHFLLSFPYLFLCLPFPLMDGNLWCLQLYLLSPPSVLQSSLTCCLMHHGAGQV